MLGRAPAEDGQVVGAGRQALHAQAVAALQEPLAVNRGDVRPLDDPEVSPLAIEQRVAAVAAGGWDGIGFAQGDLEVAARTIGFEALAAQIREAGLRYVEVELLAGWWLEPELWRPGWDLLSAAATSLGAQTVKLGTSFGTPVTDLTPLRGMPLKQLEIANNKILLCCSTPQEDLVIDV